MVHSRKRIKLSATLIVAICVLIFAVGIQSGWWIYAGLERADADIVEWQTSPFTPVSHAAAPNQIPMGRWTTYVPNRTSMPMSPEELNELNSLGYLAGTQEAVNAAVVTRHAPGHEYNSLTLLVSGHLPGAQLIDIDGNVLHTWQCSFDAIWPDRPIPIEAAKHFWRRAYLYPDGSIIGIFDYVGAVKLDVNSNVIWAKDNSFNHDVSVAEDGTIYMLEQKPTLRPAINPERKIFDDYVTRLEPDGTIIDSVSLVDCVMNSPCRDLMDRLVLETQDIFHSNTLKVMRKEDEKLWNSVKAGMVLVSFRELHTIALVDLTEKKVVWWSTDVARYQHEPTLTPHGTILLFDNAWVAGRSRVIEIDPKSGAIVWEYSGTPEKPFFSLFCSTAQYLPNGNRLVTVSDQGRAFSLDSNNNIVWEYVSPHRAGPNNELVATLFQCERLPKDFPTDWLDKNTLQPKVASNK